MAKHQPLTALGLMSGTSLDGIDAAILTSDGETIGDVGAQTSVPYSASFRQRLRACLGKGEDAAGVGEVARELTLLHAQAVRTLLNEAGLQPDDVDLIGFHGHTILHRPEDRLTVQVGDPFLLAADTGIAVVGDFRTNDIANGGEGAPLAPLYHAALSFELEKPVAVLNIGGVANVTWIGDTDILAFDTGPGNALIDDWTQQTTGRPMDEGGRLARGGTVDEACLTRLLDNAYFARTPPKSLDRDDFSGALAVVAGLSPADGAATLSAFSAAAVARSLEHMGTPPNRWLVCGGGRLNATLMNMLAERLGGPVDAVEAVGWDGDALEAQAFAFLAIRSFYGLPLSLPGTTGVAKPLRGGVCYPPKG